MRKFEYQQIQQSEVPPNIRFDKVNNGHIVETSFGDVGASEHGYGAAYKKTHDRSDGEICFFKRLGSY